MYTNFFIADKIVITRTDPFFGAEYDKTYRVYLLF